MRSEEYGPVYKEHIGTNTSVVVSDPLEYVKVMRVDGKYPERIALTPMVYYRQKRGMCLGTVNSSVQLFFRNTFLYTASNPQLQLFVILKIT